MAERARGSEGDCGGEVERREGEREGRRKGEGGGTREGATKDGGTKTISSPCSHYLHMSPNDSHVCCT